MKKITVVIASVVAFAAAATAGFFVTSASAEPQLGPEECGQIGNEPVHCVPGLTGETIINALQERGFICEHLCELRIGSSSYAVNIVGQDELDSPVQHFDARVSYHQTSEPGTRTIALLGWIAALPFGNDPEAVAAAQQWVAENAGADDTITIRGFDYSLTVTQPSDGLEPVLIDLTWDGTPEFEPDGSVKSNGE